MLRPTRPLSLVQAIALAMILVMAGLLNGIQAHVMLDHHGAKSVGLDATAADHGHSHDEPEFYGGGPSDKTSEASHDGVHHHVIDALATWPPAAVGPGGTAASCAFSKPPPGGWTSWPPHRPPCAPSVL